MVKKFSVLFFYLSSLVANKVRFVRVVLRMIDKKGSSTVTRVLLGTHSLSSVPLFHTALLK